MPEPESGRQLRLGGLCLAGAALFAAGTLGVEWAYAPPVLQNGLVETVLLGIGALLLFTALFSLLLDRLAPVTTRVGPQPPSRYSASSSMMALPAIVGSESPSALVSSGTAALTETYPVALPTEANGPVGLASRDEATSTLLIPFADSSPPSPAVPVAALRQPPRPACRVRR